MAISINTSYFFGVDELYGWGNRSYFTFFFRVQSALEGDRDHRGHYLQCHLHRFSCCQFYYYCACRAHTSAEDSHQLFHCKSGNGRSTLHNWLSCHSCCTHHRDMGSGCILLSHSRLSGICLYVCCHLDDDRYQH